MKISHILVHWSESPLFVGEEKEYSLAEFEAKALRAAMDHRTGGYLKTKVSVFFTDDDKPWTVRLDLAEQDAHGLNHFVNEYIAFLKTLPEASNRGRRIRFLEQLQQAIIYHEE